MILFLKIIIWCIWCNRICCHALMLKKHIVFQILYIIVVPLCPVSLKQSRFRFLQSPSFRQAQSVYIIRILAVIGKWSSDKPNVLFFYLINEFKQYCNMVYKCKTKKSSQDF